MGWLCHLSLGGRLASVSRWRVYPAGYGCGGCAADALLGWLCRLGLGGHLAFVSRGCVCPAWCCYGGFAAGALLAWLCRLGLGWVLGRVDVLRIRRTLPASFPLINNRPLSEGAAGASRLGEP